MWALVVFLLGACKVYNSNAIFETHKKSKYPLGTLTPKENSESSIQKGDRLSFIFSTNKGEKWVLNAGGVDSDKKTGTTGSLSLDYLVGEDGSVKFPVLGLVNLEGLTIKEAENLLESKLSGLYQDPMVQLRITNQRAIVFSGKSKGQVVTLQNNTTLIEVIAMAGGIQEFGKSNKVKIIRESKGVKTVYQIDLAQIESVDNSSILIKNKDIILIDSHPRSVGNTIQDIGPWIGILTSSLAIFTILNK